MGPDGRGMGPGGGMGGDLVGVSWLPAHYRRLLWRINKREWTY
jgi:hypothetical protein